MRDAVTVGQLNRYVKSLLSGDRILNDVLVRGEISNFTCHFKSGHLYFTLKDAEASIKTVMFRSNAQVLRFAPENGMSVVVSGSVALYERDGSYQLYARDMQPDGIGALYLAFEQIKARLAGEGLFDEQRKRPIPAYPETVGIVTSQGAAALQDMLHILGRRSPWVKILLCPALVQGEGAAKTIIEGIERLNGAGCDVIIIGRGGGSMEDLWAFNDENLARAIAASKIPVISAVGHETDFTIADFAADLRAPTPSAAAELAAQNSADVLYYLDSVSERCRRMTERALDEADRRLRDLRARMTTPAGILESYARRLDWAKRELDVSVGRDLERAAFRLRHGGERAQNAVAHRIDWEKARIENVARLVETASPMRLLQRGYSLASSGGKTVSRVADVSEGDLLATRVTDGTILSRVVVPEQIGAVERTGERSGNGKADES